ncbi:hypothetical protein SLE2022_082620 [Rubroshorea leprosula]
MHIDDRLTLLLITNLQIWALAHPHCFTSGLLWCHESKIKDDRKNRKWKEKLKMRGMVIALSSPPPSPICRFGHILTVFDIHSPMASSGDHESKIKDERKN